MSVPAKDFRALTKGQKLRVTQGDKTSEVTVRGVHETGITAWPDASAEHDADRDVAGVVTLHFDGDAKDADYELVVAITELETSAMWAIKAVVFNDPDSQVQG